MIKGMRRKVILSVVVLLTVFGVSIYLDYTIYKAKYPNTSLWMYIMDSGK